ncbi:hypothetical protein NFB77_15895 [Yersinia ruckeri]|uniref:hypothetical protein n=1 Tax=Yersinia ruckeri TaxID=29486 RepID=UPI002238D077|nr:hypothetical protein [Yersinia ruckeri]EKN4699506.1 hypothetical protein [Yersinia ruckeri]MCW6543894.1 hypothetical protein [Yersinia ruckeri]MCW6566070.1 hypothetical protein [Yersinia ruckeri]MCW6576206.1 hypothetical protein [Yersinia ruckeri]MCW6586146.1 hypothetical protein [Yersinia ruckeri]
MELLRLYGKEIFSLLLTVLAWVLNQHFKAKGKLIIGHLHEFTFLVKEPLRDSDGNITNPLQTIHTRSIIIENTGRETATKIELIFNFKPMYLNTWPYRKMTEVTESDQRYIVQFDSLSPKEHIKIEVLSINHNLPDVIYARSEQSVAQHIIIQPQRVLGRKLQFFLSILLILGFGLFVYLILLILQFIILTT